MFQLLPYTWSYFVQVAGLAIAFIFAAVFIYLALRKSHSLWMRIALVAGFIGVSMFFYVPNGLPNGFSFPLSMRTYGPAEGPVLPAKNVMDFFTHFNAFERVADIAA